MTRRFSGFSHSPGLALLQVVLVASAWLFALWLAMAYLFSRVALPPWGNPMAEEQILLGEGTSAGQSFVSPLPGLSGIEVPVSARPAASVQSVTVGLLDGDERLLGETTVEVSQARSEALRLDISPLPSSRGVALSFYVTTDAPAGTGITVGYSPSSQLTGAHALLNGQAVEGNLQFQTYYTMTARQKAGLEFARLAEGRASPLDNSSLLVGAAMLYLGVLGLYIWQAVHAYGDGQGGPS